MPKTDEKVEVKSDENAGSLVRIDGLTVPDSEYEGILARMRKEGITIKEFFRRAARNYLDTSGTGDCLVLVKAAELYPDNEDLQIEFRQRMRERFGIDLTVDDAGNGAGKDKTKSENRRGSNGNARTRDEVRASFEEYKQLGGKDFDENEWRDLSVEERKTMLEHAKKPKRGFFFNYS